MPVVAQDATGESAELGYTLRSHKGNLALSIGNQVVTPQVPPAQALKQAAKWAAKVALKYSTSEKRNPADVSEAELRGAGNGAVAHAVMEAFPNARLRIVDPTPEITNAVRRHMDSAPWGFPESATFDTRPWDHSVSVSKMLHQSQNSVTLTAPNYANLAMYDSANSEATVRSLKGDPLITNKPEMRVFSSRTLKLLQAIAQGAPVGLATDLAKVYGGRPFVVAAPGKALDVAAVKRLQEGGAVIMALWQSVEKLNAGGVVPNLAVCLDPSYLLVEKYRGGKAQALLCDAMAVQDFWAMGMPTYLFNVRSAHLHQNLWSSLGWFTLSDQSQTVSEASVWLAMLLGASSLVVMGADYAKHGEAEAKATGNTIPCCGIQDGQQWFTQWHYWGACKHMLQLAMALTHGKAGQALGASPNHPMAYFVAGGLFSHLAKLWGLVLPIVDSCDELSVTEGSVAPVAPAPTPIAKAYPAAFAEAKRLLGLAATLTPTCFADKSVLSATLHEDFGTPSQADRQLLAKV